MGVELNEQGRTSNASGEGRQTQRGQPHDRTISNLMPRTAPGSCGRTFHANQTMSKPAADRTKGRGGGNKEGGRWHESGAVPSNSIRQGETDTLPDPLSFSISRSPPLLPRPPLPKTQNLPPSPPPHPDPRLTGKGRDLIRFVRDERVRSVLAREVAREDGARHDPGGHVLHAVHADVHILVLKEFHGEGSGSGWGGCGSSQRSALTRRQP